MNQLELLRAFLTQQFLAVWPQMPHAKHLTVTLGLEYGNLGLPKRGQLLELCLKAFSISLAIPISSFSPRSLRRTG